jgi:hypothetical protein
MSRCAGLYRYPREARTSDAHVGAFAEPSENCSAQNAEIQSNGPVVDVIQIVAQSFFETCESAPPMHLRVTGESGTHGMPQIVVVVLFPEFLGEFRPFRSGSR